MQRSLEVFLMTALQRSSLSVLKIARRSYRSGNCHAKALG